MQMKGAWANANTKSAVRLSDYKALQCLLSHGTTYSRSAISKRVLEYPAIVHLKGLFLSTKDGALPGLRSVQISFPSLVTYLPE